MVFVLKKGERARPLYTDGRVTLSDEADEWAKSENCDGGSPPSARWAQLAGHRTEERGNREQGRRRWLVSHFRVRDWPGLFNSHKHRLLH
jgi:hypothetical protein